MGRRLRRMTAKVCCFLYARTCRSSKRRACLSRCQSSVSRAACDEHNRSLARLLCLRCAPIAPACLVPAPLPPPSPPHSLTTATPQLHHTAATQPPHSRRHINGLHNVTRPTHTTRLLLDALPRLLVLTLPLGCTLGRTLCAPYGYTMGGREGRGEGSVNRRGRGQGALTRLYTLQWGMTIQQHRPPRHPRPHPPLPTRLHRPPQHRPPPPRHPRPPQHSPTYLPRPEDVAGRADGQLSRLQQRHPPNSWSCRMAPSFHVSPVCTWIFDPRQPL